MAARLAWAAVVAVFFLMTLGNVVSATGSGLACPDWPLCHGSLIPPLRPDVLIEYSHRLAALAASLLIVATTALTLRGTRAAGLRRLAWLIPVLLAVQIGLGGVTVLLKLPHLISTAHLVNALLILAGLIVLARGLRPSPPGSSRAGRDRLRRLARVGLIVLFVQLALGGYVRHSGAGLACPDFPLCSGDLLPTQWLAGVHWVHRWLGVLLLGLFIHVALAGRTTATRLVAALAVLQVGLGIAAVLLQLTPVVRAAHAAVGYSLWAVLVWVSVEVGCWRGSVTPPARPGAAREAVHAA
ncbi:MAG TPA: COX15/CtaA family protein [Candidatus Limnocylindria bacterium]|nr:COX15/CtaA family protein [Candidatus Limnocylindria bacterium]